MALIEINRNPPRDQLASFGRLWTPVFAMCVSMMCWNAAFFPGCVISLSLGMVIAVIAWCNPMWLKPVFVLSMIVTFPIGVVVGFVLMAVVYYLCVMPIGLILRMVGKDPLVKAFDHSTESYWIERSEPVPVSRYFKQF
ncbi:MAG: hypothetical protein CMJ79_04985 [Planctomycetaceae bacterium]|nr:hypothetical protein [Planctomycetaceae bacterium]|tara:strand:+ start:9643 stop:10059 length:417 start_codon:yes stop_codon:yes gene_type:complete